MDLIKKIFFCCLASSTFVFTSNLTTIADDPQSNVTTNTAITGSDSSSTTLHGGVQKVELSLEKLRDVGLDLKHILEAASNLYDEVSIQPVRIITQPEMIGRGTVINIPVATQPVGPPEPARKERVDLAMNNMVPLIEMMKKNVDDFVNKRKQLDLPDDVKEKLEPKFQSWVNNVNDMSSHEMDLKRLTEIPPYPNNAIADLAIAIQKDVSNLDKTRREIYKVIRKEGKNIAANTTS